MADNIVNEHSIFEYGAIIKDEDSVAIAAASLTTMTLTYYNSDDAATINSRSAQDVLNANNVVIDSSGVLAWTGQPADSVITGADELETHVALFEYTWDSGAKRGSHEVTIKVRDITNVAAL